MILTPKEKALELLQKFGWLGFKWEQTNFTTLKLENAKECALVCVDEIIATIPTQPSNSETERIDAVTYWIEVKQELENYKL